jgi:hypothetical protein
MFGSRHPAVGPSGSWLLLARRGRSSSVGRHERHQWTLDMDEPVDGEDVWRILSNRGRK